ncbi:hypothetical protein HS7_18340 [Sulfolobales archaeon HS-7]|nr:hypothetical protein HS7_18340 [Sulfolobales archaeon HS-7]
MSKLKELLKRKEVIAGEVLAIVIIVSLALLFLQPRVAVASVDPNGRLIKVSNIDYAGGNRTQIYLISWYGCPLGATLSWSLYLALSNIGVNCGVFPHYSKYIPFFGEAVPGLLFNESTASGNIQFFAIYLYNEYLNATPYGNPVTPSDRVSVGLNEIKMLAPSWVYNLVKYWNTEVKINVDGKMEVIAYARTHLVTTLIITTPKGTWIMLGNPYMLSPEYLMHLKVTPGELLAQIKSGEIPEPIQNASEYIVSVLRQ